MSIRIPLVDYHLHTARCGHAQGQMHQYVEKALELGLEEIGFADHIPQYWLPMQERDATIAMSEEQLPGYVAEVEKLRSYYRPVKIKLGLEVDFVPGYEEEARRILGEFPFDYVLGSVHYIHGWGFDNPVHIHKYQEQDVDEIYRQYFQLVQQAARSGLFHVLAHLDLVKKFGYRPRWELEPLYDETARVLAAAGVAVEINTAGLRVPAREIYPAPALLRACCQHGVPVTTGSDAHAPEQVGYQFGQARELLLAAGYTGQPTDTGGGGLTCFL